MKVPFLVIGGGLSVTEGGRVLAWRDAILDQDMELAPDVAFVAEEFGASHVPVREAFRLLESQGLVVSEPRRGVRVAGFTLEEVREVAEMRAALAEGVIDAVETIVDTYIKLRVSPEETFLAAYRRLGETPFKEALYGA